MELNRGGHKHEAQAKVAEFHRAIGAPVDMSQPAIRRGRLRADLILEEARETAEALTGERVDIAWAERPTDEGPSLVEAIDGMCDLLVVTYGTAVEAGVNLRPFFNEVHETNMAKTEGPKRADGKQLKPPGWKPPDIAGLLDSLYGPDTF